MLQSSCMSSRRAWPLSTLTGALAALHLFVLPGCAYRQGVPPQGDPLWMWSGALTSTSATVKARVPGATVAVLVVRRGDDDPALTVAGAPSDDQADIFTFDVQGLAPETAYTYRIELEDRDATVIGRLRTLPDGPGRIRLAFGSCATTGSNAAVWDAIREAEPDLFIHMGDFHYENIVADDPDRFRRAYERALRSPRQGGLYRQVPIVYVWDDHDFGADDADSTVASSPAAHKVYREFVPHHQLAGGGRTPIYQAFDAGRVRVLITDVRTAREPMTSRTPEDRSLLGGIQLTWLLGELERASRESALIVWVNVVPWITRNDESTVHGWAPWAGERRQIANAIQQLGATRRLIMLSGDAHMLALDDGTNSQYADHASGPGPFVMHAAPLDRWPRSKGGPYSHGRSVRNQQFGLLDVDDDGTTLRVTLSGRNRHNRQVGQIRLDLECDGSRCTPVE